MKSNITSTRMRAGGRILDQVKSLSGGPLIISRTSLKERANMWAGRRRFYSTGSLHYKYK